MVSDRIKNLRKTNGYTQTELAKKLDITRSSVNAWEMGVSVPSTYYVIELSKLFKVSTDFLLGCDTTASVDVSNLSDRDIALVQQIIERLREN